MSCYELSKWPSWFQYTQAETDISPNSVTYPLEQYENLGTNIASASALNTQENFVCLKSLSFDIQ